MALVRTLLACACLHIKKKKTNKRRLERCIKQTENRQTHKITRIERLVVFSSSKAGSLSEPDFSQKNKLKGEQPVENCFRMKDLEMTFNFSVRNVCFIHYVRLSALN